MQQKHEAVDVFQAFGHRHGVTLAIVFACAVAMSGVAEGATIRV